MANLFDGENLIITLDPVVNGVLTVDVLEDLYEDGKDWYRGNPQNRRYPFPFVSDGGNPLTSVINQGAYIFVDNVSGWRIKPAENDGDYFFVGNLAPLDETLPVLQKTDGAFTVGIFGLQPVTQGVVPEMRTNLAFNTFQNQVCFDPGNVTGNAVAGVGNISGVEIGTRRLPSNNIDDVLAIAQSVGLVNIQVVSPFIGTTETTDLSTGFNWVGDGPAILVDIPAGMDVSNNRFQNLTVSGELDGVNLIRDAFVQDVSNFSGVMFNATIDGDVAISGKSRFIQCFSDREGLGYSRITNIGSNVVMVRDMRGSLGFADMTGSNHTIGVYGGRIVLENTCTGGNVFLRGAPYDIDDQSGVGCNVTNQIGHEKDTEIWQMQRLDPNNPRETDEDGTIRVGGKTIAASTVGTSPNRTTTQTRS